jgi:hypothetical protein
MAPTPQNENIPKNCVSLALKHAGIIHSLYAVSAKNAILRTLKRVG